MALKQLARGRLLGSGPCNAGERIEGREPLVPELMVMATSDRVSLSPHYLTIYIYLSEEAC